MKASSVEPQVACNEFALLDVADSPQWLGVQVARGFLARARGLLGRPEPSSGCGLLLLNVSGVHGFGMRHSLDLVFLDAGGSIVQCSTLAPAAVVRCGHARHVLEMRAGENCRLGLHRNMRPHLVPVNDIFSAQAGDRIAAAGGVWDDPVQQARRPVRPSIVGSLLAGIFLAGVPAPASAGSGEPVRADRATDGAVAGSAGLGPLSLVRPVSAQTLQRLEEEAEALYRREAPPESGAAELVRRYESLAEFSVQRSPHAWLRIGNIHQRAGSVGAAIDAYRQVLFAATAQPAATPAERKALLNLAGLALEQARQSLTRLAALPAEEETSAIASRVNERVPVHSDGASIPGQATSATSTPDVVFQAQMESLQRHLRRQQERQAPLLGSESAAAMQRSPYVVERYTASGRRNAVKAARGSLHVDPADGLPAGPLAKPRPRVPAPPLPSVEYLLGNPLR